MNPTQMYPSAMADSASAVFPATQTSHLSEPTRHLALAAPGTQVIRHPSYPSCSMFVNTTTTHAQGSQVRVPAAGCLVSQSSVTTPIAWREYAGNTVL